MDTRSGMSHAGRRPRRWHYSLLLGCILLLTACGSAASPAGSPVIPATSVPTPAATSAATAVVPAATTAPDTAPNAGATGPAASAPDVAAGRIYTATNGLFSVPVPTNWQVREENGIVRLADADGKITIGLLAVAKSDAKEALADGWQQFDPSFALEPADVQEPPSSNGVEKTTVALYDDGNKAHVLAGMAQFYAGNSYLFLMDADNAALEKRSAQVMIVQSGFVPLALRPDSLRSLKARPITPAITAELESFIKRQLERAKIPGAAVAIVQDGKVVYANGFGVRSALSSAPITPDTLMMIGSTGKSLTTMMMATLVDDGKMAWDTPAAEILPSFRVKDADLSKKLTMRNLVCACTGVPRRDFELIFNAHDLGADEIVASLASFEFYTAFGEAFQYSNQMVATGGYLAGIAAGGRPDAMYEGYAEALQKRVLDPIGMAHTTLSFDAVRASDNYALPHNTDLGTAIAFQPIPLEMEQLLEPVDPAGGHWSTVRDMANYMITELNQGVAPDGARVVSAANLNVTWSPQIPIDATTQYGLGWMIGQYKGLRLIQHGGNTFGFTSDFAFLPDAGLGIIVMTNGRATNIFNESVRTRLFELAFDQQPEAEKTFEFAIAQIEDQMADMNDKITGTPDRAAVEPFLGAYANEALGDAALALEGDALTLDVGEFRASLKPAVNDKGEAAGYMFIDGPLAGVTLRLQRNAADAPELVLDTGATPYTFESTK